MPSSVLEDLHNRLKAAEEALVHKQEHIDEMKQEIFQKEKELETISVFQAQVCVCVCACVHACVHVWSVHTCVWV